MVSREPEWSDYERDRLLALAQYEAGLCDCGFHRDRTTPGEHFYAIEESKCPVCASSARYGRLQADSDRREAEAMENAPPTAPRAADGRKTVVRRQHPFEVEELRRRR